MIYLLIKGNEAEAQTAADKSDVPMVIKGQSRHGDTIARASDLSADKVRAWYHESDGAVPPLPDGSLLFFSEV